MNFAYDEDADAGYFYVASKPYAYGEDLDDQRRIDYAEDGSTIGVEVLSVSSGVNLEGLPHREQIREILTSRGFHVYTMTQYPIAGLSGDSIVIMASIPRQQCVRVPGPTAHQVKEEATV